MSIIYAQRIYGYLLQSMTILQQLMQQWDCDATDVVIKATEKLINKYHSVIDRYAMGGDKLINFLCKQSPEYKQLTDEYLSTQR